MAEERKLPDGPLTQPFAICDNTINRYGWRLLVEGIDTDGFLLNPICCVQHFTSGIPVGRWAKLSIDKGVLKGTLEFDRNDETAVKLYWKYVDGYMNAVSLNIIPLETSDDPKVLLPGQLCPTITKSELLEVSLVTLPGQKNAVKLSTPDGKSYKLDLLSSNTNTKKMAKEEKTVEQLTRELEDSKKLNAKNLISMHKMRGVVSDPEVESLTALAFVDYENTTKMLEARVPVPVKTPGTSAENAETMAKTLVKLHMDRGAISAEEQAFYENAASKDYEGTKKALELRKGKENVQSFVGTLSGNQDGAKANDKSTWTFLDYFKKDPKGLEKMKTEKPDDYKRLEQAFVGESKDLGFQIEG